MKHTVLLGGLGQDPKLITMTLAETQRQVKESLVTLATEQRWLDREQANIHRELVVAVDSVRRADLYERLQTGERRLTEIREQRERLRSEVVDEEMVMDVLGQFDDVWGTYCTTEKNRSAACHNILDFLRENSPFSRAGI